MLINDSPYCPKRFVLWRTGILSGLVPVLKVTSCWACPFYFVYDVTCRLVFLLKTCFCCRASVKTSECKSHHTLVILKIMKEPHWCMWVWLNCEFLLLPGVRLSCFVELSFLFFSLLWIVTVCHQFKNSVHRIFNDHTKAERGRLFLWGGTLHFRRTGKEMFLFSFTIHAVLVLYAFVLALVRTICLQIHKLYVKWSFPSFSWTVCLIRVWYCKRLN